MHRLQERHSTPPLLSLPVPTRPPPSPTSPVRKASTRAPVIPTDVDTVELRVAGAAVTLTNLRKPFWPDLDITKGDLLRYYATVAPVLLPHLRDRAMVMKRYPNGVAGKFFFMKRIPPGHPDWIETCRIEHGSGNVIGIPSHAKTSGSRGIHVYVPIVRGPTQKEVWTFAKQFALTLAAERPKLVTTEYRIASRPRGRVLVDYNQNAWGRTLASVYSVRPRPIPGVSAP